MSILLDTSPKNGRHHLDKWPYIGVQASCDKCSKVFELSACARSSYRLGYRGMFFCCARCQNAWHRQTFNAEIARNSAKKRSDNKLEKSKSTHYKKVRGRHEHRIIMENLLGRKLLPTEIIHHRDGNRRNNIVVNLELMSQSEHAKLHTKERKALK